MIKISKEYDVVVVGGGISGMCAAVSAARHGAKTALVQNRPVLGGNASSEIRMHICGADRHAGRENARETGIVEEIQLLNKARNPEHTWAIFDAVTWEMCRYCDGLDLYLNTHMDEVSTQNNKIISVSATQQTTEKRFTFTAPLFIDATGDGTLGYLAGAEYMYGREDKATFGEADGLDTADDYTMGNSLMFSARDVGHPVKFKKPDWAYTYTEEDMKFRPHADHTSGYWWIELGGKTFNIIHDGEEIRDELIKTVYGIWDHIKNGGDHGADNFELDWVGMLPGKRESRRLLGDYVLREGDLLSAKRFKDAVAYGGWDIDCHVIEGFLSSEAEPAKNIHLDDVYTIPYSCLISKNIDNLFLGGRAFSASHLAFASTRVMATCGVAGQAIGTAAAMCIEDKCLPRDICKKIEELQQTLLRDDCYIPGVVNNDVKDKARSCRVSAKTETEDGKAENIINGISRTVKNNSNCYISDGFSAEGEYIDLIFDECTKIDEVHIKFDSNLSREIMISLNNWCKQRQEKGLPSTLVKDYDIVFYNGESEVKRIVKKDNEARFNKVNTDGVVCDKIRIHAHSTYGDSAMRVFEVRAY